MTSYNPKIKNKNNKLTIASSVKVLGSKLSGNINSTSLNTLTASSNNLDAFVKPNLSAKPTSIVKNISTHFQATTSDYVVLANTESDDIIVTLPITAKTGQHLIIKKYDSSANKVIIQANSQQEVYFTGSLVETSDLFGYSVVGNSTGNRMFVGSYRDESPNNLTGTGLVYIFDSGSSGWIQTAILSGTRATDVNDFFGCSLSFDASGNRIIIGARLDEYTSTTSGSGLAYIFDSGSTGWQETKILSASNSSNFGENVLLSQNGKLAVVTDNGNTRGRVILYNSGSTDWTQQTILTGTSAQGNTFGSSIALDSSANKLAIGHRSGVNDNTVATGLVHVYESGSSSWLKTATITSSLIKSGEGFGSTVAFNSSGDCLAVASSGKRFNSVTVGFVSIFNSSSAGWQENAGLIGELASNDNFGSAFTLNATGDKIIVGAYSDEIPPTTNTGLVYTYKTTQNNTIQNKFMYYLTGSYEKVSLVYDGTGNWEII